MSRGFDGRWIIAPTIASERRFEWLSKWTWVLGCVMLTMLSGVVVPISFAGEMVYRTVIFLVVLYIAAEGASEIRFGAMSQVPEGVPIPPLLRQNELFERVLADRLVVVGVALLLLGITLAWCWYLTQGDSFMMPVALLTGGNVAMLVLAYRQMKQSLRISRVWQAMNLRYYHKETLTITAASRRELRANAQGGAGGFVDFDGVLQATQSGYQWESRQKVKEWAFFSMVLINLIATIVMQCLVLDGANAPLEFGGYVIPSLLAAMWSVVLLVAIHASARLGVLQELSMSCNEHQDEPEQPLPDKGDV